MIDELGGQVWAFVCYECQVLVYCVRYDQDIGKQDCVVEVELVDWLECDFGCCVGIVDQCQEFVFFGL